MFCIENVRWEGLERAKGFEPSTPTLARLCSTTELHPLINPSVPVVVGTVAPRLVAGDGRYMAQPIFKCNREMTIAMKIFWPIAKPLGM